MIEAKKKMLGMSNIVIKFVIKRAISKVQDQIEIKLSGRTGNAIAVECTNQFRLAIMPEQSIT